MGEKKTLSSHKGREDSSKCKKYSVRSQAGARRFLRGELNEDGIEAGEASSDPSGQKGGTGGW